MANNNITHLTDLTFDSEVINNPKLVVVDFWAVWCGPCKAIAPILDDLSVTYVDKVKITKVDIDNAQQTATRFQIRSIPTLLFLKNGQVVDQIVGAVKKDKIVSVIEKHLG